MDPRLLRYYNLELQHLREMGAEFAQEFPKIAARLGMNGLEVSDPYVERLIEGFGFLAARVHLKLDAEFPRFTQALLETVYPHYLAPTPSMLVAQCTPDNNDPNLARGIAIPIVPGILPVQNFKQMRVFAERCGTGVPAWLADRFAGLDADAATRKLIAAAVAAEQVLDLVDRGVTDFHFYTMNRADLVYAICHLLGVRAQPVEQAA